MTYIKAFIAGMILPSLILPFGLLAMLMIGKNEILGMPSIHAIPLVWGAWNVLYFAFLRKLLPENLDLRLFITGALLGLLVAIYGVFVLKLPSIIGLPGNVYYGPLFALPILYGILWRFIVKPLNDLLGLYNR
jgi:hypothetical protein